MNSLINCILESGSIISGPKMANCLLVFVSLSHVALPGESVTPPRATSEAASEKQRLTNLWDDWRERTQSLRIEGWRFIGIGAESGECVSRDQLLELVFGKLSPLVEQAASAGRTLNSPDLDALCEELFPFDRTKKVNESRSAVGWERFVFVEGAGGRRFDSQGYGAKGIMVRKDGAEQRYDSRLKQASIYPTETGFYMESLSDFMHTPELKPLRELENAADGRKRLVNRGQEGTFVLEYDPVTGLVSRDVRQLATGAHVLERIQEHSLNGTGLAPFARMIVKINFHLNGSGKSNVSRAFIYIVESAISNVDVTESTYHVAVPKHTAIVDFGTEIPAPGTKTGVRHPARRVSHGVADVLKESQRPDFPLPPPPSREPIREEAKGDGSRKGPWIILNSVIVVCIAVWWYRVRRKARGPE